MHPPTSEPSALPAPSALPEPTARSEPSALPDLGIASRLIYHGVLGVTWMCRVTGGLRDGRVVFGRLDPEGFLRIAAPVEAFTRTPPGSAVPWEVHGADCEVTDDATH